MSHWGFPSGKQMELSWFTGTLILQVGTQAQVSHHNSRSKKEQGHPGRRGETRHFAPSSLFSRLEKGPAHFVASHPHIKHDPVSTSALDLCALSFSVVVSRLYFYFIFWFPQAISTPTSSRRSVGWLRSAVLVASTVVSCAAGLGRVLPQPPKAGSWLSSWHLFPFCSNHWEWPLGVKSPVAACSFAVFPHI